MATLLQKHLTSWQDCKRCALAKQRRKIVLLKGQVPCDVAFVGEAPGASEDVLGKPFVGPAGHLLDKIVASAVPPNVRLAFTNLVACFPREQKEAGVNAPPKEAISVCSLRLKELLQLCKPSFIVAVGDLARKNLSFASEPVVPIVHPAAILRMDVSQRGLAIKRCVVSINTAIQEHLVPF